MYYECKGSGADLRYKCIILEFSKIKYYVKWISIIVFKSQTLNGMIIFNFIVFPYTETKPVSNAHPFHL